MEETKAVDLIQTHTPYQVCDVSLVEIANGHEIYKVNLRNEGTFIARFERNTKYDTDWVRRDFHFNSILSVERQAYLTDLLRVKAGTSSTTS